MSSDYSQDGIGQPASFAFDITPDDNANLDVIPRAIYIGVTGDVKVDMARDGTVTFVGVAAGEILPIRVKRVYDTNTTATNIIGLY